MDPKEKIRVRVSPHANRVERLKALFDGMKQFGFATDIRLKKDPTIRSLKKKRKKEK